VNDEDDEGKDDKVELEPEEKVETKKRKERLRHLYIHTAHKVAIP
jgi:hypothetical protein